MFAIVKTGGKQYRVKKDSVIRVEKLPVEEGSVITLDQVLMVGDPAQPQVGAPFVHGAKVEASVLEQIKDKKILIFKKKRRHNYRRKNGHRQRLTILKIINIVAG